MGFFSSIFGDSKKDLKVREMLAAGAVVVDVRSKGEFAGGHVAGSRNYPLPELEKHMKAIKKIDKGLVLCCASGNRSGQAARILKEKGIDCENGGSWRKVNKLL